MCAEPGTIAFDMFLTILIDHNNSQFYDPELFFYTSGQ